MDDDNLGPRGQKRILDDDVEPSDTVAENIASLPSDDNRDQDQVDAYCCGEGMNQCSLSTGLTKDIEMVKPSTSLAGSSTASGKLESTNVTQKEEEVHSSTVVGDRLRKKVKTHLTRQGSAPPRLELGFNSTSTYQSDINAGELTVQDQQKKHENAGTSEVIENDSKEKEYSDERMEKLLDDLETEVTCGLCAGTFIDPVALNPCSHVFCGSCIANWIQSYQPSTRMAYTNPFPALTDYMRRKRDIATARYEDGYDSASSAESEPMIRSRSGRAIGGQGHDDASDGEDDYLPVNPYIRRAREYRSGIQAAEEGGEDGAVEVEDATVRIGIHKTPKEGLKCPTCRCQPVVDAMGSCLVTSMVDLVNKHRPDLVRPANEIAQAHKVYKKGDKLSFPLPAASSTTEASTSSNRTTQPASAVPVLGHVFSPLPSHRSGRRSTDDHWTPCYHCAPLRSHESEDRYVCPEPIAASTHRTDYGCPPGHSLCSICRELGPEALRQTCSGCGEGVCGMPTRGCKIPKLAEIERLTASSSFTQIERLTSAIQIQEYGWTSYRTAFQHNYYELANFILYCIRKNHAGSSYNAGHQVNLTASDGTSSTASRKITMVDIIKTTIARDEDSGGVKGVFERANKAWPWVSHGDPERLCKLCVNSMLEASIFEWWMKEAMKPEIASQLPPRQPDCKYGRNCAFQEDVNHTRSFSHLCERLPESEFSDSTQPTPSQETSIDAPIAQSPEALLRHAIIHSGPAFNLSSATMEDLRWQDNQYSRVNAASRAIASATENVAVAGNDYHSDDESDHSEDEYGSRGQTPASEIYREMGMESKAVQTEFSDGREPTSVLAAAFTSEEEPTTSVGRTVVDYYGEPMEFEEDSSRTEEALLPLDSMGISSGEAIVHAAVTLNSDNDIVELSDAQYTPIPSHGPLEPTGSAGTSALSTTVSDNSESSGEPRDNISSTTSSSIFDYGGFKFSRGPQYALFRPAGGANRPVASTTIPTTTGPASASRALSSHESIVEDLIVPRPGGSIHSVQLSHEDEMETTEVAAIATGRTNGMVFQSHLQAQSQPGSVNSPRSSPEPEAIMI